MKMSEKAPKKSALRIAAEKSGITVVGGCPMTLNSSCDASVAVEGPFPLQCALRYLLHGEQAEVDRVCQPHRQNDEMADANAQI